MDSDNTVLISVVSPVYLAEKIIDELVRRIETSLDKITPSYEIVLVEDGSPDRSWEKIMSNCERNPKIKGIKLSRNFGQHHAITAGLDNSNGEWIVVMDCDLQDVPEEIEQLYYKALEGYDIVFASRVARNDSFFKKLSSKFFYKTFTYLTGIKQDETIANFGIYSRKVVNEINQLREPFRAFSPMARWVGFKRTSIPVAHSERFEGKSSYNWKKLLKLAFDIAIGYSEKPLRLIINFGFIVTTCSFLIALYYILKFLAGDIMISGYTSIIISIWLVAGLTIFVLGIVGLYISRIFESVKNRPIYILDKKINL